MSTETKEEVKFQSGDEVTWMHCVSNGSHMRFTARRGTIVALRSKTAYVRMRNGRKVDVHIEELRKLGQETALTELVKNL